MRAFPTTHTERQNMNKTHLIAALLAAGLIGMASAKGGVPREIYQPRGAQVVKADHQGDGEYEVEFRLRGNDVRPLAKQAINHAKRQGFSLVESDIERDDADLKFQRHNQEMDISIEHKGNGRIEYKVDLDRH